MLRSAVTRCAVLFVGVAALSVGVAVPCSVAAEEGLGTIRGEIEARGVRKPEDVLVFLEHVPGDHKPPADGVTMDQKKLTFDPHVLPIVKGTTVKFQNNDPLLHNVFWPKSRDSSYGAYNLGSWGTGAIRKYTFEDEGHVVLLCNIHPEMEGHVVVLQNAFFAVTDEDGTYEIKNVPVGQYTLKTWYSNPKKLRSKSAQVTVQADKTTDQDFSLSRR
ncbi:MAG: carboxypeptidase regulatory-like domain-containing protein [Pirellulaceae bacterium]